MTDDLPRPLYLVTLVAVCLAGGFALARASLDVDRARLALAGGTGAPSVSDLVSPPDAESGPAADPTPDRDSADGAVGTPVAPEDEAGPSAPDVPPAEDAVPPPAIAPQAAAAPAHIAPARITHGRVAYLRCGDPGAACPRDHGVERRVWEAIDGLTRCDGLGGQSGPVDLRVVFDEGRYSGIGFRDLGAGALPPEAVRSCLEVALRGLVASPGAAPRLSLAFRFDVVRDP